MSVLGRLVVNRNVFLRSLVFFPVLPFFKGLPRMGWIATGMMAVLLLMAGCGSDGNPAGGGGGGDGNKNISYIHFTDERDGKTYKTVKIGDDVWMAENLNHVPMWQGFDKESCCYDDKSVNCGKYGRLYTWVSAIEACPIGWHLPSNEEWERLFKGAENDRKKFASRDWYGGTDDFGFSALAGGSYEYGTYGAGYVGIETSTTEFAGWWSVEKKQIGILVRQDRQFVSWDDIDPSVKNFYSVRCVQDKD